MRINIIICIEEIHGMIYKDAPWMRKNTKGATQDQEHCVFPYIYSTTSLS
jgi:hypothetical protein